MLNKNILISGAGIAGPSVSYWLQKYGFNPVVIEHAPFTFQRKGSSAYLDP